MQWEKKQNKNISLGDPVSVRVKKANLEKTFRLLL